ncbi:MAG: SDR family NAD(P)-dependent oxidoreductase [Chloroflexi bacterium]|nr:SDR family NAD(P)-dependent oxidoreductase [Chloroflexota bacterium]
MLGVNDVMLSGKKALVTGGGGGIGRGIALTFANVGADVAVIDLKRDGAEETAAQVRKLGRRAVALHGDVADRKALEAAFTKTLADLGGLDIVVNNAGMWKPKPALWTSEEEWDQQVGGAVQHPRQRRRAGLHADTGDDAGRLQAGPVGPAGGRHTAATHR